MRNNVLIAELPAGGPSPRELTKISLPTYVVESWNALSGPAGIPDDVVRLLNRSINEVLQLPEVQERAKLFGLEARGTTPEEMQRRLKADIEKWAGVVKGAGIKAE